MRLRRFRPGTLRACSKQREFDDYQGGVEIQTMRSPGATALSATFVGFIGPAVLARALHCPMPNHGRNEQRRGKRPSIKNGIARPAGK
jgi:hypothetical protein